jgi:hypothetical protein
VAGAAAAAEATTKAETLIPTTLAVAAAARRHSNGSSSRRQPSSRRTTAAEAPAGEAAAFGATAERVSTWRRHLSKPADSHAAKELVLRTRGISVALFSMCIWNDAAIPATPCGRMQRCSAVGALISTTGPGRGRGRGRERAPRKFNDPDDIQFLKILKGHEAQVTAAVLDAATSQVQPTESSVSSGGSCAQEP